MYAHDKNYALRQFLKRRANSEAGLSAADSNVSELIDVIEIFDVDKMKSIIKRYSSKDTLYRNNNRYLDYLDETNGYLPFATIPASIDIKLDKLQLNFPNFIAIINYYRQQIALSQLAINNAFYACPLLITGPPGVGKTSFCKALAHVMKTHFEVIGMSGVTAGFVLGGMSSSWSDGKPGKVVESLARGKISNPLILLDEIDKTGEGHRYDPLGSLHQLLETETAVNFIDEGLEVAVNCSKIVWISTANDLARIPEPILSRFEILEVQQPDRLQMYNVLRSIYQKILIENNWGYKFSDHLEQNVIDKVICSRLSPRLIKRELISACGRAALSSRRTKEDGECYEISPDDFRMVNAETREVRMGF